MAFAQRYIGLEQASDRLKTMSITSAPQKLTRSQINLLTACTLILFALLVWGLHSSRKTTNQHSAEVTSNLLQSHTYKNLARFSLGNSFVNKPQLTAVILGKTVKLCYASPKPEKTPVVLLSNSPKCGV